MSPFEDLELATSVICFSPLDPETFLKPGRPGALGPAALS